jgi:hypothetical protein
VDQCRIFSKKRIVYVYRCIDFYFFLQIGLAGNLRDYVLISHSGEAKKGSEICTFDGSPVGYTTSPIETVFIFL